MFLSSTATRFSDPMDFFARFAVAFTFFLFKAEDLASICFQTEAMVHNGVHGGAAVANCCGGCCCRMRLHGVRSTELRLWMEQEKQSSVLQVSAARNMSWNVSRQQLAPERQGRSSLSLSVSDESAALPSPHEGRYRLIMRNDRVQQCADHDTLDVEATGGCSDSKNRAATVSFQSFDRGVSIFLKTKAFHAGIVQDVPEIYSARTVVKGCFPAVRDDGGDECELSGSRKEKILVTGTGVMKTHILRVLSAVEIEIGMSSSESLCLRVLVGADCAPGLVKEGPPRTL